ncbi:dephospho-CoA kinase [Beijerinckia sp. L45]|uniref:dephospho-CoA kinase n=1 Tax=Beijerinckia sp. L45 TaxID=1641855 RepID=UPI00131C22EF|nr:dephospho-CoA kinase [Beijerinckia sp. L45]
MIVLGLTGSIGMGKSTTAALFVDEGILVFDSDAAVHRLYSGRAAPQVETRFPGTVRDGIVDREALGRRVLGDAAAMKALEAIVHPLVREERASFLADAAANNARVVVLDIPLLYETGAHMLVDRVVLVSAPEAVQKARVLARRGMTPERFAAILAKQMPDADKRRRADIIIETGDGIESARRQVRSLLAAL